MNTSALTMSFDLPIHSQALECVWDHRDHRSVLLFQPQELRLPSVLRAACDARSAYFLSTPALRELDPQLWPVLRDLAVSSPGVVWLPVQRDGGTLLELLQAASLEDELELELAPGPRADVDARVAALLFDEAWLSIPADTTRLNLLAAPPTIAAIRQHGTDQKHATDVLLHGAILRLHEFFVDWFLGRGPKSGLSRLDNALADDFSMVSPGGSIIGRSDLLMSMTDLRGSHDDLSIEICNFSSRRLANALFLVHYQEWQNIGGTERGRQSTAILELADPVRWHHVQETWLPE